MTERDQSAATLQERISTLVERAPNITAARFAEFALPLLMEANEALTPPTASDVSAARGMAVGEHWVDETPGQTAKHWTVTCVGKRKVHLRAEFPEFTATATAWIRRILASPYWRRVDGQS